MNKVLNKTGADAKKTKAEITGQISELTNKIPDIERVIGLYKDSVEKEDHSIWVNDIHKDNKSDFEQRLKNENLRLLEIKERIEELRKELNEV